MRGEPIRHQSALCALSALILISGSAAPPAFAQAGLFVDSGQSLGGEQSSAVALGDVDGDNDLDAFVANFDAPSKVWVNQGGVEGGVPGVFLDSGQALGSAMNNAAVDVALGDLDGDNDLDAFVVLDSAGDSNQVWINQGGAQAGAPGTFQSSGQIFGDDLSSAVALGDVDGDSDLDAFITRSLGRADKVWINQGGAQAGTAGLFADSGQTLGSDGGTDVALGDVDGDSDLDAFVVNGLENKVWVNQGGTQMGTAGMFADSGQNLGMELSLSVALADVDGDNDLDAFVGNSAADRVWINQGGAQAGTAGTFADSGQVLGGAIQTRDLALGDVDGDTDLDAFLVKSGANRVLFNQGGAQGGSAGSFSDSGQSLGSAATEGLALGDVDGDSDLDAFTANFSGANKVWNNETISVLNQVNPLGWQVQYVDVNGQTGRGASLALDASGTPHISYIRFAPLRSGMNYQINYARFDGVRWVTELVEELASTGSGTVTSLALDSSGNPRIAYQADGELRYAAWDGSQWQIETIVATDIDDSPVSLALDSTGNPRISYEHDSALHYASWNGASWDTEPVDAESPAANDFNALALDAAGRPHITYNQGLFEVRYARRDGSGWLIESIDAFFARFADLALDGSDVPHVSYRSSQEIRHAVRTGGVWQFESVADVPPFLMVSSPTSIALDSADRAHISYSLENLDATARSLRYARSDGSQWQLDSVDADGVVGSFNSLALDATDRPRIAYYDEPYGDLRYASFDRRWQSQSIDAVGTSRAPSIAVANEVPVVGDYDQTSGLVRSAQWENESWVLDTLAFVAAAVEQTSVATAGPGGRQVYASFYDADAQRLMFGAFNGASWDLTEIDASANVGRYNELLFVGGQQSEGRIAYWDASNLQVKVASFSALDPSMRTIRTNPFGPPLDDPDSGPLAAAVLAGGDIGISYYDGVAGDLRLATWHENPGFWSDQTIDTVGDVGRFHDLAGDASEGVPVVAYHDATDEQINFAYRAAGGLWQIETAVPGVVSVSAVSLELGLGSRQHPRIAYVDDTDNALRVAVSRNGNWFLETVATLGGAGDLGLALGQRPHLAVAEAGMGLTHVYRTATLDVLSSPLTPPPPPLPPTYNPLDACQAVLDLFTGTKRLLGPLGPPPPSPSEDLGDREIFDLMDNHFAQTSGGQHYINLYFQHGSEMGMLALADRTLLRDGYGALKNVMPGLGALVTGRGDEVLIDQQMVDDTLDIWQRLAAAGSPALAQTINSELAKYNNLQDFVGMSFDEWFDSLVDDDLLFADSFE